MKQFRSINRAIKRGHLKMEFNKALGRIVFYKKVKKKFVDMKGNPIKQENDGWAFYA